MAHPKINTATIRAAVREKGGLMTMAELAEKLGVDEKTLKTWVQAPIWEVVGFRIRRNPKGHYIGVEPWVALDDGYPHERSYESLLVDRG